MADKKRVLILCTANSARSQMGEGLLRALAGDQFDVFSAGSEPAMVNPFAISVMDEIGIDISGHYSKNLIEFLGQPFDFVITVCDNAAKNCPFFPGKAQRIHWGLEDPAAAGVDSPEETLMAFRKARDLLKMHFVEWLAQF